MPASGSRSTNPISLGSPKTSERVAVGSWAVGPIVLISDASVQYLGAAFPYAAEADVRAEGSHHAIVEVPDGARYLDMYYLYSGVDEPTAIPTVRVYGGHRRRESPDIPVRLASGLTLHSRRWPQDVNPWFSDFNVFWKPLLSSNPNDPHMFEFMVTGSEMRQLSASPSTDFPNVGGITSGTLSRFCMTGNVTAELLGSEVVMAVTVSPAAGPEHNLIVGFFRF
jgi:hypothetical protein